MIEDGGPAFPLHAVYAHGGSETCYGLSLRDYFAAKAMQGELAAQREDTDRSSISADRIAKLAYAYADAMIKARSEPAQPVTTLPPCHCHTQWEALACDKKCVDSPNGGSRA